MITRFLEVRLETCVESQVEQKASRPDYEHKSHEYFAYNIRDPTLMRSNHSIMVY
jgi:hypothetical protein